MARHADATHVELSLTRQPDGVLLRIADDGRGIDGAAEGAGIRGMRERAILIGAGLQIAARAGAAAPTSGCSCRSTDRPASCSPTTTPWSAAACG